MCVAKSKWWRRRQQHDKFDAPFADLRQRRSSGREKAKAKEKKEPVDDDDDDGEEEYE